MQPYFLPYIGYFQLMKAVNTFVFYDDVTYIKQGWINRNRIIMNGNDYLFTLELKGASSFKEINRIEIGNNRNKLLKTFIQAYQNAPFFKNAEPLLYTIFKSSQSNLSSYIIETQQSIAVYLGIKTRFEVSSEIDKSKTNKGQNRLIQICNQLGADIYINSIGGRNLYSKVDFAKANIELCFLEPQKTEYRQFNNKFIPWLSIIDLIMFNSPEIVQLMLNQYNLI
jgi:hypothetical protein